MVTAWAKVGSIHGDDLAVQQNQIGRVGRRRGGGELELPDGWGGGRQRGRRQRWRLGAICPGPHNAVLMSGRRY
jgi:hypothetical protein